MSVSFVKPSELPAMGAVDAANDKLIWLDVSQTADADKVRQGSPNLLNTLFQPLDSDLTAIAALTPTKGNVIVGNGSDWVSVGVGTDDQVFTADSAQASGTKWADASGGAALTVKESDGTPSVSSVDTVAVTNGILTDDGSGDVTLDIAGQGIANTFTAAQSIQTDSATALSAQDASANEHFGVDTSTPQVNLFSSGGSTIKFSTPSTNQGPHGIKFAHGNSKSYNATAGIFGVQQGFGNIGWLEFAVRSDFASDVSTSDTVLTLKHDVITTQQPMEISSTFVVFGAGDNVVKVHGDTINSGDQSIEFGHLTKANDIRGTGIFSRATGSFGNGRIVVSITPYGTQRNTDPATDAIMTFEDDNVVANQSFFATDEIGVGSSSDRSIRMYGTVNNTGDGEIKFVHCNVITANAAAGIFSEAAGTWSDSKNVVIAIRPLGNGDLTEVNVASHARLIITPTGFGFNGSAAIAKPTITGSRGGNAALQNLLSQLDSMGLVTDSTT